MPVMHIPRAAVAATLPRNIRPQVASSCAEPPVGDGWLHEPKHDGHRLIVITTGDGTLKLISRNGIDRTALFRAPFLDLAAAGHAMVLDGEIAVPDEEGVHPHRRPDYPFFQEFGEGQQRSLPTS